MKAESTYAMDIEMGASYWGTLTKKDLTEKNGDHSFLYYLLLHNHWEKLPHKLKKFSLTQISSKEEKIIHLMARTGKVKTIPKELLTHEVLSLKGEFGDSVYHTLAEMGYTYHIPQELWTRKSLTLPNNSGATPLHTIAQFNPTSIPKDITLNELLVKSNDGQTPLMAWASGPNWHVIPDKFITRETLAMPHGKDNTIFEVISNLYKLDHHNSLLRHKKTLEKKFKKILMKADDSSIETLCENPNPTLRKPARQEASKRKLVSELSQSEQCLEI